jgi:glycosyltransferase involved in cell wall biosynthesis
MSLKLVILTEIVSPYRIPVFNALAEQGDIDLHVIFLAETDATQREWIVYRDEIKFRYQVLASWRRRYGTWNILLNRGLTAALHKIAPDVILCGGYNYLASWQALAWARKRGVPFLAWVESTAKDDRSHSRLVESLKRRFISNCSAFVVPGRSSDQYMRNFDIRPSNIFVAPNAVDVELFAQKSAAARAESMLYREKLQLPSRFFLYVGRLVEQKGIFDLLDAYGTLAERTRNETGLVFVGNGPDKTELMARASMICPGTVKFAGFVQRDELPYYYGLAEACILPTYSDPWGLVVNEAMACGLPVVVTDVAGCAADLVEDRWNGFLIAPRQPSELASTLEILAGNVEMGSTMGQRGQERIVQYSPEICAAGIARAALSSGAFCHA